MGEFCSAFLSRNKKCIEFIYLYVNIAQAGIGYNNVERLVSSACFVSNYKLSTSGIKENVMIL